MSNRFSNYIENHSKAIYILVLACVMVIVTSVVMTVPRVRSIIECEEIISSLGGREAITANVNTPDEDSTGDVFENANNSNTKETTYADTEEYKTKQDVIDKKAERYADLTENDLMLNLGTLTSKYFSAYSDYASNPSPAKLNALKDFTTTEYFENVLKKQTPTKEYYLVNDVKFADFDKDTIYSIVTMRGDETGDGKRFSVSYVKDKTRGYVISDVRSLEI